MLLTFSKSEFRDRIRKGVKIHSIREDKYNRWKAGMNIHFWLGNPRNKRSVIPKKSGYYYVIWEEGDIPVKVYIWVNDFGLCWGHDENDDPESVELDVINPENIKYYKSLPYQFGVGICEFVLPIHIYPKENRFIIGDQGEFKEIGSLNELAENDGFDSWEDMKKWFTNEFHGKIIYWKNFELTANDDGSTIF